jgi:hypothetical protein
MSTSHNGHAAQTPGKDAPVAESDRKEQIMRESKQFLERAKVEAREDLSSSNTGAAIAGGAVVAAAVFLGLPETILGAAAGWVVYKILERGRPPAKT